ncbi:MAG: dockerin type I domain-containing protein [Euryarchaeota archaeon]|nr:dockerin type I domain-containing protein [Euryarchaeota archaeon]
MKTILLTILLLVVLCMAAHTASAAPTVSIEPSYQDVLQGDLFTVNITVDPQGVETMGAQYYLHFNNTLLNATEQIRGDFLSQDGVSTNTFANKVNNTIGVTEYGETRIGVTYGVTTPGVLASVTFRAVEPGVCNPTLSDVVLSDPDAGEIPNVVVNNGTVNINETHFVISGSVSYDSGDPVPDPNVTVTNLNTNNIFIAEINASSYQISTNFTYVSSGDILHFDVSDGLGNSTAFNHTVTQDEMDEEGFVQNITIHIPDTTPPTITNIIATGVTKDSATIRWDTDEPGDSLVKYGTDTGNYTKTIYYAAYTLNHSSDLSGLSLDTTYYYVVNSTDESTNSAQSTEQSFKTFPEIIVKIGDAVAMTGENATTSIVITNIANLGTADITLTYNQSVVHVLAVDGSDFDFMGTEIDNVAGRTRIGAFQTSSGGLNGTVTVANITLGAVGSGGDSAALNLTINELKEAGFEEISIPASVHNGSFTVWETMPPLVVNPSAYPPSIPEDTDSDPKWGETAQLNVTVTDECGVKSVTINLTSIGGLSDQIMTRIPGTDVWTVTVNASVGSAIYNGSYIQHDLVICATDTFGNANSSVSMPLTAILNGDVSENGEVTLYDATYLANHILNKPGFETMNERVADVSGNGLVTFYDAMYLSKHVLAEFGFGILH